MIPVGGGDVGEDGVDGGGDIEGRDFGSGVKIIG